MQRVRGLFGQVCVLVVLTMGTGGLVAEEKPTPRAKFAPSALAAFKKLATGEARNQRYADATIAQEGDATYSVWNLEFKTAADCQAFMVPEVTVISRYDRFADVFLPADEAVFRKVADSPGLVWHEWNHGGVVPPPVRGVPRKEEPRQIPEPIVQGGIDGLTGKGVIIAIIDTGIDFRHQDFVTYDDEGRPQSRVLAFWDTTSELYAKGIGEPAPVKYPNGAAIGTIYSREVLTADLRTPENEIPTWDANGHGTACAGIAAGNGNASKQKYQGVAPGADIIAVRVTGDSGEGVENGYLIGAICDWLDNLAKDRPLVVSCSYGGHTGGHDGETVEERQLSVRFSPDRKGRAVCIAAGNEGADPIHAAFEVGKLADAVKVTWDDPENDGVAISIYVKTDDVNDVALVQERNTELSIDKTFVHGLTQNGVVEIMASGGAGGFYIYSQSGKTYAADAYIDGGSFPEVLANYEKLVGTPGGAANAITVGSYDWNDAFFYQGQMVEVPDFQLDKPLRIGRLSTYSSAGLARAGQVKPDIVAPGQWFTAPWTGSKPAELPESSGHYALFNGTSAATPYTAGIIALLFEKQPALSLGELKDLLKSCATEERPITGQVPNPNWGYGKLDVKAMRKMLKQLEPAPKK